VFPLFIKYKDINDIDNEIDLKRAEESLLK
jgi:hypothetical protein